MRNKQLGQQFVIFFKLRFFHSNHVLFKTFYVCIVLALFGNCVTEDEKGNIIKEKSPTQLRKERLKAQRKVWQLKDYTILPDWSEKDLQIQILLSSLPTGTIPKTYKIRNLPPAGKQGRQASGTAWATGYTVMSLLQQNKGHSDYLCSPAFVYNSLNDGKDSGIEIIDALNLLLVKGCPNYETMPYRSDDFRIPPHTRAINEARKYVANNIARVEFRDLDQIRAHLLQNFPIIISMIISSNFVTLFNTFKWIYPVGVDKGRQTLVVFGYDDTTSKLWIQNSFGSRWGKNGQVQVDYAWFLRLTKKAYVLW